MSEAKLSSEIENIVTTNDELYRAFSDDSANSDAATKEVLLYQEALWYGYHALNYIFFLVKYCKFKINKIYNTNGLSIDNIVNKIIETNDLNDIYNLFLVKGEKPKQCIVDIPIEEIMLID